MSGLPIVDAQIHQPAPPVPLPEDFGEEAGRLLNVEIAREAMDSTGVDAALVVAGRPYVEACVARYPGRFIGVETFQATGAALAEAVEQARADPAYAAGRLLVTDFRTLELAPNFTNGGMDAGFAAAEAAGLPLFVSTHGQAAAMRPVIERHPRLTLVIDHLGVSQHPVSPPRDDPWDRLAALLELGRYPNVHVKVCGLPLLSREGYPFADTLAQLRRVIAAFGAERLMWASDYTRLRMAKTGEDLRERGRLYSETRDMLLHTAALSEAEKRAILGETCMRVIGWRPGVAA